MLWSNNTLPVTSVREARDLSAMKTRVSSFWLIEPCRFWILDKAFTIQVGVNEVWWLAVAIAFSLV